MSKFKIYEREELKMEKSGNPKLVGGRYLVELSNAYFHNDYVIVKDMHKSNRAIIIAWLPNSLNDKSGTKEFPKTSEQLFNYLSTAKRCEKFMNGKVTKVRVGSAMGEKFGSNILYNSY